MGLASFAVMYVQSTNGVFIHLHGASRASGRHVSLCRSGCMAWSGSNGFTFFLISVISMEFFYIEFLNVLRSRCNVVYDKPNFVQKDKFKE